MTEKELNSVRDINKHIRDIEWRLQALKTEIENIVPVMDGLPHSKTVKVRVERLALNIVDSERELAGLQTQFINAALNLSNKIDNSPLNQQEKTILSLRYVSCLNFQDIWLKLHASDAQIFYLHNVARKKFLKNSS